MATQVQTQLDIERERLLARLDRAEERVIQLEDELALMESQDEREAAAEIRARLKVAQKQLRRVEAELDWCAMAAGDPAAHGYGSN